MHIVMVLLGIVVLTAALLWAVYNTGLGALLGALIPQEFWAWLHAGSAARGAETGYDLELAVFTLICALLATLIVLLVQQWLRKSRR